MFRLLLIVLCSGCLSMVEKKNVIGYKINDSVEIVVQYVGGGATAPDYLKVVKKSPAASTIIKVLDGYTNDYVFHLQQLNDSIVILNMIDTAQFTTVNRNLEFRININQIDTTLNKYM